MAQNQKLTHLNAQNHPSMVDVSAKQSTFRVATAQGSIYMNKAAFNAFETNSSSKGPIIDTAVTAAIMGAKKTSDFIPMCHPLCINKIECKIATDSALRKVNLEVCVKCDGKTGVEMEALSGVSIGLLTIYDMLKALDKSMTITDIVLLRKSGGKSGDYTR